MAKSTGKCKVCGASCNQDAGIKVPVGWFCGYAHLFKYQREKTAKARERQSRQAMTKPTAAESSYIARVVAAGCIVCRNLGYGEMKITEMGYQHPMFTTNGSLRVDDIFTSEGVV